MRRGCHETSILLDNKCTDAHRCSRLPTYVVLQLQLQYAFERHQELFQALLFGCVRP